MGKDYQGALQELFNLTFKTFRKSIIVDGSVTFGPADISKLLSELTYLQTHGYVQLRRNPKKKKIGFTSGLKNFFRKVVNANVKSGNGNGREGDCD